MAEVKPLENEIILIVGKSIKLIPIDTLLGSIENYTFSPEAKNVEQNQSLTDAEMELLLIEAAKTDKIWYVEVTDKFGTYMLSVETYFDSNSKYSRGFSFGLCDYNRTPTFNRLVMINAASCNRNNADYRMLLKGHISGVGMQKIYNYSSFIKYSAGVSL